MQILFLADAIVEDFVGGSRVVAKELALGLVKRGHNLTFLIPRHSWNAPDDVQHQGIRIVRYLGAGRPQNFIKSGYVTCKQLLADQTFDVVHTHFAYAAFGPLMAIPHSVPHVRSFHGPWDKEGQVEDRNRLLDLDKLTMFQHAQISANNRLKLFMRRQLEVANLRRSKAVVVLSEYMRREVMSYRYPAGQIYKIVGGADVRRFIPPQNKPDVRRTLGLSPYTKVLLSIRRLVPRMGLDSLIQAMQQVINYCPNVLLLIGGDGPEKYKLQQLITATGMNEYVHLLGFIPDQDLVTYYQAADLFVLPTIELEGFGLVTLEALASGTPVLGTSVGATPEIIAALDPRLIVSKPTPTALAAGIIAFLNNDWAQELEPTRLHNFACRHYSWDQHISAMESLYYNLVDPRSKKDAPG